MTKEISEENCLFYNWNYIDPFYGLIVVDDIIAKAEQSGVPVDSTAYISRAMFLAMSGKMENAFKDFTRAIKLFPDNPHIYEGRSLVYMAVGESALAVADMKKADELRKK